MNFNNQHPSDEIIERELRALREPMADSHGMSDAIRTMQASPAQRSPRFNPWVLRLGSVGLAAIGIAVGVSLTTSKAFAQELKDIASSTKQHVRQHTKSYLFGGNPEPMSVVELWTSENFQKMVQYQNGKLQVSNVSDGSLRYNYYSGGLPGGMPPDASIDVDQGEPLPIETIESMLNSEFFRKHRIAKQTGVMLNGRAYDYYDFANGYYRMWVDPATKLPVQREIYDKGKTLWERDIYEYPAEFSSDTFKAPDIPGMTYFDYPTARTRLEAALAAPGTTRSVGGVKVTLKAIIKDRQSLTVLFESTGGGGKFNDVRRLPIPNVRFFTENFHDDQITIAKPSGLKNERMYFTTDSFLKTLETIKIGVWDKDKFVGYAEFPYKNIFEAPYTSTLLMRPVAGPAQVAKAASTKRR